MLHDKADLPALENLDFGRFSAWAHSPHRGHVCIHKNSISKVGRLSFSKVITCTSKHRVVRKVTRQQSNHLTSIVKKLLNV